MFLAPSKQITSRFFVAEFNPEHDRRAPQNDIATSPQGDRRQSLQPQFSRENLARQLRQQEKNQQFAPRSSLCV